MLQTLEEVAKAWQMEKVVLTALTNNERSVNFYKKSKYTIDESNPDDDSSYVILSKCL